MPDDPSAVGADQLEGEVRRIISDVLMVDLEEVQPETALIDELGAESIDFLDLVFQIEESLGRRIPVDIWQSWVRTRLAGRDPAKAITTRLVLEFARAQAGRK